MCKFDSRLLVDLRFDHGIYAYTAMPYGRATYGYISHQESRHLRRDAGGNAATSECRPAGSETMRKGSGNDPLLVRVFWLNGLIHPRSS